MHQLLPDDPGSESLDDQLSLVEVVRYACKKNKYAFEVLYEYYKGPLTTYLTFKINDEQSAYDLWQETSVRMWKELLRPGYVPPDTVEHFKRWLYTVAHNAAVDYLRHNKKFVCVPLPEDEPDEPGAYHLPTQLSVAGHEELICEELYLKQALAAMSPKYKECVLLQDYCGLTQREIASILNISESAVSSNVSRGYEQLDRIKTQMSEGHKTSKRGSKGNDRINLRSF